MCVDSEKDDMNSLHSLLPWVPLPRTVGTQAGCPCSCSSPAVLTQLLGDGPCIPWDPWGLGEEREASFLPF